MNDTTLTQGLLTRLDAVTAKMGVAASEVWNIWIATSWRPMMGFAVGATVALLFALVGWLMLRKGIKIEEAKGDHDLAGFLMTVGAAGCVLGFIVLMWNVSDLPEAITYLNEPRLYALDQLRGLLSP